MKIKFHLLVFIFTICMLNTATSKASQLQSLSDTTPYISLNSLVNDTIIVEKTTDNEFDIYTFVPNKVLDNKTISAIEARYKVIAEGFVSLSVDNNNKVKLVIDSSLITQKYIDYLLSTTIRLYEYTNYKIEKR